MRKRINTKLPKAVEEIRNTLGQLRGQGKEFKILGMTFEELNEYQETEHDRQVQEERDLKKQEKMKITILTFWHLIFWVKPSRKKHFFQKMALGKKGSCYGGGYCHH